MTGWDQPQDVPTYKFEEAPRLTGSEFSSSWVSIDQKQMDLFDKSTYYVPEDYGWDVENFPSNMVEGFHLLSLLPPLMNLAFKIEDPEAFFLNYGIDHLRFVEPVFAGDEIRLRGKTSEVKPKGEGYLITNHSTVELRNNDRPAMVVHQKSLLLPRIPADLAS